MRWMLPEEEEYDAVKATGDPSPVQSFEAEMRTLVTLSFGIAIMVGVLMVAFVVAYAVTGSTAFLLLNLVVSVMAIVAFFYLLYRRSRLTIGY